MRSESIVLAKKLSHELRKCAVDMFSKKEPPAQVVAALSYAIVLAISDMFHATVRSEDFDECVAHFCKILAGFVENFDKAAIDKLLDNVEKRVPGRKES